MAGQATVALLQRDVALGKLPANQVLHRSFIILGGFLLFIPGFISDIVGVCCILPGSRHILVWYVKRMISRGLFKGRVFTTGFGFGHPGGFGNPGGFRTYESRPHTPHERDAEVVDIEPIEITHTKKTDDPT